MFRKTIYPLFLVPVLALAMPAQADEVRVGLMAQDIKISGIGGVKGKEEGIALTLEYVADSPEFLEWALKPKPYAGGTINLSGDTSYGGAGMLWRTSENGKFYGELAFGLVIHDGELELPSPGDATTPEQALEFDRLNRENIEFGSRALFRTQFAAGFRLSDDWSAELVYEHLSHGKILSNGSNEGLDSVGVRIGKRF
ncbi:MAG: hypothetical protein HKN36_08585 [Hellea sp.]|nr:hypothetical protein [Hellea sp.]